MLTHQILPISAIVPTRNRTTVLNRTFVSLWGQSAQPKEIIVVDASDNKQTARLCTKLADQWSAAATGNRQRCPVIRFEVAQTIGAAAQRNQGVALAKQPVIWFFDDDVLFEQECVMRLWLALHSDSALGGVSAMITNQRYVAPGHVSRTLFRLLHGKSESTYAGKCIGPALNLLPEDRPDLPDVVPVEWLNTTCTLYRREALPQPPFPDHFTGYSLMEDVTLSLVVGTQWKLANARTARIYHDSQPAAHKQNISERTKMELVNRHYVMTQILGRQTMCDYLKLLLLQTFGLASTIATKQGLGTVLAVIRGNVLASREIVRSAVKR